jgi:hypothetical protein
MIALKRLDDSEADQVPNYRTNKICRREIIIKDPILLGPHLWCRHVAPLGMRVKLSRRFHKYGNVFFRTQMNAGKRARNISASAPEGWRCAPFVSCGARSQTPMHQMPRLETRQRRLTSGSARNSAEADMSRVRLRTALSCRICVCLCSSVSPIICQRIYETVYLA